MGNSLGRRRKSLVILLRLSGIIWRGGVAISLFALAGCVVGPNYRPPSDSQLNLPSAYPVATPTTAVAAQAARWWEDFDDPTLTKLIDLALADNLSLAQAAERIAQAEEARNQARGEFFPKFSTDTTDGRNFSNKFPDSDSFSGNARVSWLIDLFGGLARNKEASTRFLEAAGFDYADLRTTIAAQIAESYINYRSDKIRLGIALQALAYQRENEDIAKWRAMAGLVSDLDVQQARIQSERTAGTIPAIELSLEQSRNRMSVLTGRAPGAMAQWLADDTPIPVAKSSIDAGVPADVLRQRPDVRASERRLAGATALIGVAKAQLLPQLTLTGNIGTSAQDVSSLGDVITAGLFGSLSQSLFEGGNLRSRVRERRAAARESLASYRSSILNALQEVSDSIAARNAMQSRLESVARADTAADAAVDIARAQYRTGLTSFQSLLTAEQSWLSAKDDSAFARSSLSLSQVRLFLAIGGGWDASAIDAAPEGKRN